MIQAYIESLVETPSFIQIRGKHIAYWIQLQYQAISFIDKPNIWESQALILYILENKFLKMDPEGIAEIINKFGNLQTEPEEILSIPGIPFIAISPILLKKMEYQITPEDISQFQKNNQIRFIELETPHETLKIPLHLIEIESCIIRFQILQLLQQGIWIEDFNQFYIEAEISVGTGTKIGSGVVIKGNSQIGAQVEIGPHCYIENSTIHDHCKLLPGSVVRQSVLEENVHIGPYAHLREGSVVKKNARMGNFVEMKKSTLGEGSKAMHLSYLGDAQIGKNVNIGAGTITCNYDGQKKHPTLIEDNVFIGSGTELIAPVTIHQDSYVAAGSTITEEVPSGSLAVSRQKQRNLLGWVNRKRKKPAT